MRVIQHIIDTKAVKKVLAAFPDEWVIRELSERDYGIDLMIEIFERSEQVQKKFETYDSTGYTAYLQIKGTEKDLNFSKDNDCIKMRLTRKHLMYVEKFPIPFFLLRVSTTKKNEIYFIWLQRYISEVIDYEYPNWRIDGKRSNEIQIKIPKKNKLVNRFPKIINIAARIKYVEELAEFLERINRIKTLLEQEAVNNNDTCNDIIKSIKRIKKLKTLLKYNNSSVGPKYFDDLINYIIDVKNGDEIYNDFSENDNFFNLNQLCSEFSSLQFVEDFEAKNNFDTSY